MWDFLVSTVGKNFTMLVSPPSEGRTSWQSQSQSRRLPGRAETPEIGEIWTLLLYYGVGVESSSQFCP